VFSRAKYFSKLDAKAEYRSVHFDEPSQLLTTFRTPFGRFCWRRLPFGLNVSPDIFQARIDEILEGLDGIINIADDVGVYGATAEEHDVNLLKLMERAAQRYLVFNSTKCSINKIKKMPAPQSKYDLQRFLGMLTYLSQYIPHFAGKAHPLRGLLKAGVPWTWDVNYQACFETLKEHQLQQ